KEKGDYSVIVSGALNRTTGTLYVYDAYMERCHPNVLIGEVVSHTFKNQYEGLGVEAQAAQEFIADRMSDELQARGYPAHTRLKQISIELVRNYVLRRCCPIFKKARYAFIGSLRIRPKWSSSKCTLCT